MTGIFNGHIGANAGHVKQAAFNSKNLRSLAADTPEALRDRYVREGRLPVNASTTSALKLQKQLREQEHAEYAQRRKAINDEKARRESMPGLSYPIKSKEEIISKCKGKSPDEIIKALGIKSETLINSKKELSHYGWAPEFYSFKTAGIDERELIKDVESIKGTFDATGSYLENLGDIKSVGKLVIPRFTNLKDLSGLKYVGTIESDDMTKEEITELAQKLGMDSEVLSRAKISGYSDFNNFYYLNLLR